MPDNAECSARLRSSLAWNGMLGSGTEVWKRRGRCRSALVACALLAVACSALRAQIPSDRLLLDAVPALTAVRDSFRLDCYIAVPHSLIVSVREGEQMVARYSLRLRVENTSGARLFDTTIAYTSSVPAADPAAPRSGVDGWQLRVPVGRITGTATLEVVDLQRNTLHSANVRVATDSLAPASASLRMGGLLLLRKVRAVGDSLSISPLLSPTVPSGTPFYLFCEVERTDSDSLPVLLVLQALDPARRPVGRRRTAVRAIPTGRSPLWIEGEGDSMPRGVARLRLSLFNLHDTARALASVERDVAFEGSGMSVAFGEEEMGRRIAQLRYVATGAEMEEIRGGTTLAERQRRYVEFWHPLDPTPRTARNEAMEQYQRRVDEANVRFRGYAQGWLTDRGRVYILYGMPDNVQTDPWRADGRPVETWNYYRRGRRLTFLDETGFGDFRLVTPLPPGERYRYEPEGR